MELNLFTLDLRSLSKKQGKSYYSICPVTTSGNNEVS